MNKPDYTLHDLQTLIGPQWMYRLAIGGGWKETGLYRKNPNQWRKFEEDEVWHDLCKRVNLGESEEELKSKITGTSRYCNNVVEFRYIKHFKRLKHNPTYPPWITRQ
jgi:hypothetical protein